MRGLLSALTFEMAVVEGKTDAVQPEALEERCVLVLEEVLEELESRR